MKVRQELPDDAEAIHAVHRLAFGQEDEARLVDALREGGFVRLSLVAELEGNLVGHVLFSRLPVVGDGGTVEALALAPVAVLPEHHRQGVGSQLIGAGLELCREQGHRIVFVLGEPEYYRRFGFRSELAAAVESAYAGEAFLAVELAPGALQGVRGRVEYPPPFAGLG